MRALAQRSAEAAKEIKSLISTSGQQVSQGVALVGETGDSLARIVEQVAAIDGLVAEISASAQEQASSLSQVNTAVSQMDQLVQQNAAMVEESTAASYSLKTEAGELDGLVSRFKLGDAVSARPSPSGSPGPGPERAAGSVDFQIRRGAPVCREHSPQGRRVGRVLSHNRPGPPPVPERADGHAMVRPTLGHYARQELVASGARPSGLHVFAPDVFMGDQGRS